MALTFNSTDLAFDNASALEIMDVYKFVDTFKYPIEKLYIDRFWISIQNNDWVVVDYTTLRWMGYDTIRDRDMKRDYLKLLERNFIACIDYEEVAKSDLRLGEHILTQAKTIIVRCRRFKESLMILQTQQSRTIRRYYTTLEEIMIDYMRYTKFVADHNNTLEKMKLMDAIEIYKTKADAQVQFDISAKLVDMQEYLYVLSSKRYYRSHMFKIGKTTNPKQRLVSYNTGTVFDEDQMFYLYKIPTFDCGSLEKLIHKALTNYHFRKEWYQIPQKRMLEIIKLVMAQQAALCNKINEQLSSTVDNTELIPIESFMQAGSSKNAIEDAPNNGLKCKHCFKVYKTRGPYAKHIKICNSVSGPKETIEQPYQCSDCKNTFTSQSIYNSHLDSGCKYIAPCPNCNFIFQNQIDATNHECDSECIETTPEKEEPQLTESSSSEEELPAAPVAELKKDGFKYRCSLCKHKFLSRTNGMKHIAKCEI